ncbi:hypothetical protein BFJ66_g15164 [Fusarium oxysporum f. sp. cepae]|uniref:Uncharacterized protein n=1 Tax=Fusarium oxysporum f. sp. cepae TaxID=396571 RepID=A0A3L6MZJ2_FUSOX|nr:hypothetical protein BFJ65_g14499 [Fusarium oxysporum f. sp. cepae]RKK31614.1 hypothetical protein BFJ67_g15156 [Fusarium oxysporum f. sp. cepae]RKK32897.1 hypothetical protein BFJ66_g15164 [Fusarium oxysporum f. sp. cepae]
MKVETPLYYALMLARLASGQNFSPECDDAGPVLYPGTWNQYLAPYMGVSCQKASILFSGQDTRQNLTIEHGDALCYGFPLMNITIPINAPPGPGSIRFFCEGREAEYCQMISVETRPPDDAREASATEYAITQDCPVNPTLTSEKYASASSKPTTVSTPTPKGVAPIGTAPTRAAMETPANQAPTNQTPTNQTPTNQTPTNQTPTNQTPTNQTPTNQTPTKELSDTKIPETDADKPDPTGSGRSGSSDTDSATSTTNGDMPNETTLPLTGSHAAGSGAAQTTQSSEYTDIAAPALPESGKTHAPPSPSNEAQASGDNRPCTCGQ